MSLKHEETSQATHPVNISNAAQRFWAGNRIHGVAKNLLKR